MIAIGVVLLLAVLLTAGHVSRIADAMEAQNRHYGIGKNAEAESTLEEAA